MRQATKHYKTSQNRLKNSTWGIEGVYLDFVQSRGTQFTAEGGTWTVPAGKLEAGENPVQGAKRELFEETGIEINSEKEFKAHGALYIRKPDVDYVYHMFSIDLPSAPSVRLSVEHCSYQWVSSTEDGAF
jgi:8-oxo-dGTP pyrophosphatase MutT (NUDIX family)